MGKLHVAGEVFEFDFDDMTNREVMEIQKVTGMKFGEWINAISGAQGADPERIDMVAMTALVYVVKKRIEPDLRFDDVEFALGGFDLEADDEDEPGKETAVGDEAENSKPRSTATPGRSRNVSGSRRTTSGA